MVNPARAQDMIIKLSDFMRYSLSQADHTMTTLKKEIENSVRYLEIEKVRFGQKLMYQIICEDITSLDKLIPIMLLQPLYENAVKHGVYESTQQVSIITKVVLINDELHISIKNDFDPEAFSRRGEGIGLKNINDRLKLIYHNNQLLTVIKNENTFEVKLIIPQNNG
jgi:LytS/YehU family sensor histidine kinase